MSLFGLHSTPKIKHSKYTNPASKGDQSLLRSGPFISLVLVMQLQVFAESSEVLLKS